MKEKIVYDRVTQLIVKTGDFFPRETVNVAAIDEVTFGAIGIIKTLYENDARLIDEIVKARDKYIRSHRNGFEAHQLMTCLKGILTNIKFEIENGLIATIIRQVEGEVFGNFTSLAKKLIEEGHKDAAAVLACAALEDSMKKFAQKNGLNVEDEQLATIINILKSKGLLKGAQSSVVQSYVTLRNKAFHAQFEKIAFPEVMSLISFVEQFLIQEFN